MVKLTVRERESIQEAVRRFRKLVERSGIKKEMRRREFFEKPSETKRRARLRAERRTKRNRLLGVYFTAAPPACPGQPDRVSTASCREGATFLRLHRHPGRCSLTA